MKHGSLFSGIGGFDLAAQWMGWENVFHCEKKEFGRQVLSYYWPNAKSYDDVTTADFSIHAGQIDVLTGGFPCQPFSTAGKRKGSGDDRHLFPATIEVVKQVRPRVCVFENVLGLTSILESACETDLEAKAVELFSEGVFDKGVETIYRRIKQRTLGIIISQIEEAGYKLPETLTGEPIILCVPACGIGAPHQRYRIWIVAYSNDFLHERGLDSGADRSETARGEGKDEQQSIRPSFRQRVRAESGTGSKAFTNSQVKQSEQFESEGQPEACRKEQGQLRGSNSKSVSSHASIEDDRWSVGEQSSGQEFEFESGALQDVAHRPGRGWIQNYSSTVAEQFAQGIPNWRGFPTQSPLCDGDDGLPTELDGITVSNHRRKTIEAGGDAIVPQIAFEIFKSLFK